jgi:hypothetical protein
MKRYCIESRRRGIFFRQQKEEHILRRNCLLKHVIAGKIEESNDGKTKQRT